MHEDGPETLNLLARVRQGDDRAIAELLANMVFSRGAIRLVPCRANGCPAPSLWAHPAPDAESHRKDTLWSR